jgi:hypothetical protein
MGEVTFQFQLGVLEVSTILDVPDYNGGSLQLLGDTLVSKRMDDTCYSKTQGLASSAFGMFDTTRCIKRYATVAISLIISSLESNKISMCCVVSEYTVSRQSDGALFSLNLTQIYFPQHAIKGGHLSP